MEGGRVWGREMGGEGRKRGVKGVEEAGKSGKWREEGRREVRLEIVKIFVFEIG